MNRQLRPDCPPIADYLSRDAVDLINKQCEWSFDTFNYDRIIPMIILVFLISFF